MVGVLPGVPAEVPPRSRRAACRCGRSTDRRARELRAGRVALVLVPLAGAGGALGYRFDPTRPEARLGAPPSTTSCSGRPAAAIPARCAIRRCASAAPATSIFSSPG